LVRHGVWRMETVSQSLSDVAFESAKDEYIDSTIYRKFSEKRFSSNLEFNRSLVGLAEMERRHYEFWSKYCPGRKIGVSRVRVYLVVLLRLMLGLTFAVRYLERNESRVIKKYKQVAHLVPEADKGTLEEIIADEEEHERKFSEQFEEPHIKYISFIVLGLADALVEIAGIHAGSLGIYNSTELAGLAGIIAGAAASVAMASAAYAQAKAGFKGSAAVSAIYTGISYFVTAVVLATPYFLTKVMLEALFASLVFAVLLIAFISFYGSVISDSVFTKDFAEITSIMFGATMALYLLGLIIRHLTGITI
jgi:VIT1/CCC1 family predicted Fe2+/Mn2+ transporter